jgi:hypothetical protein
MNINPQHMTPSTYIIKYVGNYSHSDISNSTELVFNIHDKLLQLQHRLIVIVGDEEALCGLWNGYPCIPASEFPRYHPLKVAKNEKAICIVIPAKSSVSDIVCTIASTYIP